MEDSSQLAAMFFTRTAEALFRSKIPSRQTIAMKQFFFCAATFVIALTTRADTLVVLGQITSVGSATVVRNALVTVALGGTTGATVTDSARTDALGKYEIVMQSSSAKATITTVAQGYQTAQNVVDIVLPVSGAPDTIRANFALRPSTTLSGDTTRVTGIVADAASHVPIFGAMVVVFGIAGVGGAAVSDTARTDSAGAFALYLLSENRYYPSVAVTKDGYRSHEFSLPSDSRNIQLDTMLIEKFRAGDSITYTVSGAITDSLGAGIRSAFIQVRISNGAVLLFSGKDTSTQLGGYYSLSTKQPYYPGNVDVEVHVDKSKYFSKDTLEVLTSSTQNVVINISLFSAPAGVLVPVAIRRSSFRPSAGAAMFTADGRFVHAGVGGSSVLSTHSIIFYKQDGLPAKEVVSLH
jgi:hypothetical protein